MKPHNLLSVTVPASLLGVLLLTGCKSGGSSASNDDSWTGYGSSEFPYDAAGNYVGGGYDDAGSATTLPTDSTPTPNYGGSTPSLADTNDYSSPTPPSNTAPDPTPSYTPPAPTPAPTPSYNRYTVRRGDTASSIARAYGTSVSALLSANNTSDSNVYVGRTINVPGTAPAGGSVASSGGSSASYRVQRGDTLYSISRRFGVSQNTIASANGLNGTTVVSGQTLRIPGASGSGSNSSSGGSSTHRVARGDTLYSIARRYGVSQSALRSANNLSGNNVVLGSTLRIP